MMSDDTDATKQVQRTFLRERFLRMLSSMTDKNIKIQLCDRTNVTAQFGSTDVDVMNFLVTNLRTPIGIIPTALLRSTDITSINCVINSNKNN